MLASKMANIFMYMSMYLGNMPLLEVPYKTLQEKIHPTEGPYISTTLEKHSNSRGTLLHKAFMNTNGKLLPVLYVIRNAFRGVHHGNKNNM